MAEGIAVEGLRLVKDWLPTAVADGKNLAARAAMLVAASMGATAFQKGLGAIHALSHPVGAVYDTHHGLTNAVVMPYVLAFNRKAIEGKLTRLSAWLEMPNPGFDAIMNSQTERFWPAMKAMIFAFGGGSALDAAKIIAFMAGQTRSVWTGVKDSGRGCSLSQVGFEQLTRPKSFHLRTAV